MVDGPMNATPEESQVPRDSDDVPTYAYKPNLVGAPWVFQLKDDGLEWHYGRRSGLVPYDRVQRVRMSFRPATLQSHRFLTEIWSPLSPKLQISSTSFRSMMEQARQDAPYREFVTELHRRFAAAGTAAQFQNGMHPLIYWMGAVVFGVITVALAVLLLWALRHADWTGAVVLAGVAALFLWQAGGVFYRNRPGRYRPDALPPAVLPRG
jgi:hypothetical protein